MLKYLFYSKYPPTLCLKYMYRRRKNTNNNRKNKYSKALEPRGGRIGLETQLLWVQGPC